MKKYSFVFFLFSVFSCTQTSEQTDRVVFDKNDKAEWITDDRELPLHDSLYYFDWPAPLFRKEFVLDNEVDNATIYITAAGYYKATINTKPVGKNVLDPAWTDYSKRIYYSEYDITSSLVNGTNCLGVSLGNGFYNPLPLRKWGQRNLRNDLKKVGNPGKRSIGLPGKGKIWLWWRFECHKRVVYLQF